MRLLDALFALSHFLPRSGGCASTGCFALLAPVALFVYVYFNGPVM